MKKQANTKMIFFTFLILLSKTGAAMDNELLVKSIRELCKKNNIAISQLESELNFGAGLISRWVKNSPSIDKIVDIANYFHVSLDEVVGYCYQGNDLFIKILVEETENKSISWEELSATLLEGKAYQTEFKGGYIKICASYHNNIVSPTNLELYIRPPRNKEYVKQEYGQNELQYLWKQILFTLPKVPVEVKAEKFKIDFVNCKKKDNKQDNKKSDLKIPTAFDMLDLLEDT